jgi:hypothetical protein
MATASRWRRREGFTRVLLQNKTSVPLVGAVSSRTKILAWYQDVTNLREDSHPGQELLLWRDHFCGKCVFPCCDFATWIGKKNLLPLWSTWICLTQMSPVTVFLQSTQSQFKLYGAMFFFISISYIYWCMVYLMTLYLARTYISYTKRWLLKTILNRIQEEEAVK